MRPYGWILSTGVAAAAALSSAAVADATCGPSVATPVPQPTPAQLDAAGLSRLPFTGDAGRVDLIAPPFSNPTAITNPLFPIASLRSAILNGRVEGDQLKIETTLLPDTRIVEWSPGQCVRTLISQFVAYRNGRIEEVALDHYAQADDGSVWYFGEDVFNYERGAVGDTAGSWLAGKEGPAAMIMPGSPKVGDVLRPENIPGLVFEEVTVKRTGLTVDGPRGPVGGAIVGGELHDDGSREDKLFAPGYGEFRSAGGGDVEAMALAIPTDAAAGTEPPELGLMLAAAERAFSARRPRAALGDLSAAWRAHRGSGVPPRLVSPVRRALAKLARARTRRAVRLAALAATDATLDLLLRYRPPAEIDRARFTRWARQAMVDAQAGRRADLRGDVAVLTWIRDRIARDVDPLDRIHVDRRLADLEAAVADRELGAARRAIAALLSRA